MLDKIWKQIWTYQQGFRVGRTCHVQILRLIGRMRTGQFKGAFIEDIKGANNCVNRRKLLIEIAKQFPDDGVSLALL
jgi:hypothetical protein